MRKAKIILMLVTILIFFYLGHWLGKIYGNSSETIFYKKLVYVADNYNNYPIIDLVPTQTSIVTGMAFILVILILYLRFAGNKKNYRHGEEHGSAKFLSNKEIKYYADPIEENNMIFTKNSRIGLYNKRLPYSKQANKNVLVLGGSGSGKTYTYAKPNAMQLNASKLFSDTKGILPHELGTLYKENDYKIKIFDLITFLNTNQFNIFKYIKSELDIDRVAEDLVEATKKSDNKGEDFWIQAELMLIKSLIGYLYIDGKYSGYEPNLPQITNMIKYIDREDPEVPSIVEMLFEDLEKNVPGNYASRMWTNFNNNFSGETRNSVKAIIVSRFSVFEHEDVKNLLERDTLEIEKWNIEKTAIFISVPEVNKAYQFISGLLFATILRVTMNTADEVIKGNIEKPLIHFEMYLDEFAQLGKIANLSEYLSVVRSREISLKIILQGLPQLDVIYGKETAKAIINNCDTMLMLGTRDKDTLEYASFLAGNQTIDDTNYSESRQVNSGSSSKQHSKLKRELLTAHEIYKLDTNEALLYIGKNDVYKDYKATVNDHKNKKYLANHYTDPTWYKYKIYRSDYEEFIDSVADYNIIDVSQEEIELFAL